MSRSLPPSQTELEELVLASFSQEVNALKPGNVSRYSDGHEMTVKDFMSSAEQVSPLLCNRTLSLGERVLLSVEKTIAAVNCNTNLGMILLFAPIVMAAEQASGGDNTSGREKLEIVLKNSTLNDAQMIFRAIRKANPGGLGHSDQFDVHLDPQCSLLAAMEAARERDNIAKQYVTSFSDIFTLGLDSLRGFTERWNGVEWAIVACYLNFLSTQTDSHIGRKFGNKLAEQVKTRAKKVFDLFKNNKNPEDAFPILLEFDRELKSENINPGTSADLTAASILVFMLGEKFAGGQLNVV